MSRSVRMRGNPLPLEGPELKPGDKAPDFRLHQATKEGLKDVTLEDFKGKTLLLSAVPSLDTSVCATATKKFNEEAGDLPDNVRVLVVSADLPFAQARFCGDNRISAVDTASDHRDVSFAQAYGVLIPPSRVLARAVFVVNPDGRLAYVEYVSELTQEPDYEAALSAARSAAGA